MTSVYLAPFTASHSPLLIHANPRWPIQYLLLKSTHPLTPLRNLLIDSNFATAGPLPDNYFTVRLGHVQHPRNFLNILNTLFALLLDRSYTNHCCFFNMKAITIFAVMAIATVASAHSSGGITNPKPGCNPPPNSECGAPFCGCDSKRWLGGGPSTIPRRFVEYLSLPNGKYS